MRKLIQKFAADENGATAIEYGLIASGIALALIVILPQIGGKLAETFTKVSGALG